jgi:hypothetical protein
VNVRVPVVFVANEFDENAGIQIQNATEDKFPVVLDQIADVSFQVTSKEMLLSIDDFATQLINRRWRRSTRRSTPTSPRSSSPRPARRRTRPATTRRSRRGGGTVTSPDATEGIKVLVPARRVLRPQQAADDQPRGRSLARGRREGAERQPAVVQANTRGDTDGLIEASIGRKFGFDTYESQVLGYGPGNRGEADGVAFHRDAIALATRALEVPLGKRTRTAPVGAAVESYKGIGLRVVYDYDVNTSRTSCRSTSCTAPAPCVRRAPSSSTSARAPSPPR